MLRATKAISAACEVFDISPEDVRDSLDISESHFGDYSSRRAYVVPSTGKLYPCRNADNKKGLKPRECS